MLLKLAIFAVLAFGCMARADNLSSTISEEQRQQLRDALRQQCSKNADEAAATNLENAGQTFVDCIKGLINMEVLNNEIEAAKPNGALDEVFKKYCDKSAQFKACIHSLTSAAAPCLDQSGRTHLASADNATDQLIDFICYRDGDRIALFIAEGGPQCIQQKAEGVRTCATNVQNALPTTVEAAKALSDQEQCRIYDELSTCIVHKLEECETPTPGNMAESLFRFVRKGFPCDAATP